MGSCFGADDKVTSGYNKDKHVTRASAAIPLMLQHYWWSEECLHDAGVPTTVLRGNFFMNHLLKNEQENISNGFFESPLGDCRNSFVAANDMAEAAVLCMTEGPGRHANKFYDITGPEPQSMYEVAEDFEYLNNGFYTRTSPCFYNLTGRKPTSYADYLVNKGAAGETGLEELFQAGMYVKGEDKFAHLKNVSKL